MPVSGGHHAEILKRFLAPAQKRVALLIALEFEQRVDAESFGRAELIHLHRMIDHQIGRDQRIGALGIGRACRAARRAWRRDRRRRERR